MNKLYFSLLISSSLHAAMSWYDMSQLSDTEKDCIAWFEPMRKKVDWAYKDLSPAAKTFFEQGTSYSDHQDVLTQIMSDFAAGFCAHMHEQNQLLTYDEDTIRATLIKLQNCIAARMFVFNVVLTDQDRATMSIKAYQENPEHTRAAIMHYGEKLADELVRLRMIEQTPEARTAVVQDVFEYRLRELCKEAAL